MLEENEKVNLIVATVVFNVRTTREFAAKIHQPDAIS